MLPASLMVHFLARDLGDLDAIFTVIIVVYFAVRMMTTMTCLTSPHLTDTHRTKTPQKTIATTIRPLNGRDRPPR